MAENTIQELRAEAKRLGITWADVKALKQEGDDAIRSSRESIEGPRRRAWELFLLYSGRSVSGCKAFWRVGWEHTRCRLENNHRDFTSLSRYDEIASGVGEEFPEWRGRDAEDLFEWLFLPYEPRPSAADLYAEALGRIEAWTDNSVPF